MSARGTEKGGRAGERYAVELQCSPARSPDWPHENVRRSVLLYREKLKVRTCALAHR